MIVRSAILKKLFLTLILAVIISFTFGCGNNNFYPIRKTVVTKYGETLMFEVMNTQNLHHEFLTYTIQGDNDNKVIVFAKFNTQEDVPKDPLTLLEHIAQTEHVNLYRIQNSFFFSSENVIDTISYNNLKDLKGYLKAKFEVDCYSSEEKEIFLYNIEKVFEAFVDTKKIEYMQYCASFLLEQQNTSFISLINRWATGDLTEEEITINSLVGYN